MAREQVKHVVTFVGHLFNSNGRRVLKSAEKHMQRTKLGELLAGSNEASRYGFGIEEVLENAGNKSLHLATATISTGAKQLVNGLKEAIRVKMASFKEAREIMRKAREAAKETRFKGREQTQLAMKSTKRAVSGTIDNGTRRINEVLDIANHSVAVRIPKQKAPKIPKPAKKHMSISDKTRDKIMYGFVAFEGLLFLATLGIVSKYNRPKPPVTTQEPVLPSSQQAEIKAKPYTSKEVANMDAEDIAYYIKGDILSREQLKDIDKNLAKKVLDCLGYTNSYSMIPQKVTIPYAPEDNYAELFGLVHSTANFSKDDKLLYLMQKAEIDVDVALNKQSDDRWVKGPISDLSHPDSNLSFNVDCAHTGKEIKGKYTIYQDGENKYGIKDAKGDGSYTVDKRARYIYTDEQEPLTRTGAPAIRTVAAKKAK